mgnify:CR=1 FL=1
MTEWPGYEITRSGFQDVKKEWDEMQYDMEYYTTDERLKTGMVLCATMQGVG